jgi:hypothetical protein
VLRCALFVALVAFASSASAQSIFIEASAGADIRRFAADPEKSAFDGTARTFAFAAGTELHSHWVASGEVDLGGRSIRSTATPVVIFGESHVIHNSYTSERRSFSALAGYRTAGDRRVRMGYYGGVVFTLLRREIVSDAESIVLQTDVPGSVYEQRLTGPVVGADVAVRAAAHVSILGAVRAQGLRIGEDLGGHSVRPSIGVRISF